MTMSHLTDTDLQFVVRRIPKDVRDLLTTEPFFLGGGFIRETIAGGEVRDIDLFGPTKGRLIDAADGLATRREVKPYRTDNAITVLAPPRLPVQFITRWAFTDAEALAASFDFTVCQAVVWFDKSDLRWKSVTSDAFYPDLAARRLTYTSPVREEEPGGSLLRVRKFLARGYSIQAPSLAAVVSQLMGKVRNVEELTQEGRTRVLAGLLYEVDPLLVVDGLEAVNEHDAQGAAQ
jgi:hypothetical protein